MTKNLIVIFILAIIIPFWVNAEWESSEFIIDISFEKCVKNQIDCDSIYIKLQHKETSDTISFWGETILRTKTDPKTGKVNYKRCIGYKSIDSSYTFLLYRDGYMKYKLEDDEIKTEAGVKTIFK